MQTSRAEKWARAFAIGAVLLSGLLAGSAVRGVCQVLVFPGNLWAVLALDN
jgi:hypothetical protein